MSPTDMARDVRRWIWSYRVGMACSCVAGACCLYAAIDDWLIGAPFRSAVFTAIAFWNGHNFVNARARGQEARDLLQRLRSLP